MLAVWTILASGPVLSSLIGGESAALLVFLLAAALLVATRRSSVDPPGPCDAVVFALAVALGFAGHPPLCGLIVLVGLALGLDPSPAASPGGGGLPLLIAVVVLAPIFEELLYRERLFDAVASTPLGTGGATLATSALFALTHLTPWHVLGSFLVGIALALLRRFSRSVTACIGLHAGLNLRSVCECAGGSVHG
jgi:membrane protease YdiL (CAAX protease family)